MNTQINQEHKMFRTLTQTQKLSNSGECSPAIRAAYDWVKSGVLTV